MTPPQNIIERVKGLLQLAKSSNVHEATLALSHAQALMTKWKIESLEVETPSGWKFAIHTGKGCAMYYGHPDPWECFLLDESVAYMGGEIIIYGSGESQEWVYAGLEAEAKLCKLIFWDLRKRIEAIFKSQKANGVKDLHSFACAATSVIFTRMKSERDAMIQSSISERGLVTLSSQAKAFEEFFKAATKHMGTITDKRKRKLDGESYMAGKQAGAIMPLPAVAPTVSK